MEGVCLTNSSYVVLGADVDGVSGRKFEGSLKTVGPDHHNSLSTRSFPEQPLEGMSAGFMFPLLYVCQFTDHVHPMLNVLLPRPVVLDPKKSVVNESTQ